MGLGVSSRVVLAVAVVVGGAFLGVNNTLITTAVLRAAPVERPVASVAYSFIRFVGGAATPFLAGLLAAQFSPSLPFYVGSHTRTSDLFPPGERRVAQLRSPEDRKPGYSSTSHGEFPSRNSARSVSAPVSMAISASGAADQERPNVTGNPASRRSHASASRVAVGGTAGEASLTAQASSTASERAEAALMARSTESTVRRRSNSVKAWTWPVMEQDAVASSLLSTKEQRARSPFGREGRICPCGSQPGRQCNVARISIAPAVRVEILPAGLPWRSATVRRALLRAPAEITAELFAALSGRSAPRTIPLPVRPLVQRCA